VFEWEESTFLGLKALYQRLVTRPRERERAARQARLAEHRGTLVLLARMLAGRQVGVFETDDTVLCTGDRVCLPAGFSVAASPEDNLALYELKTILAALALREGWTAGSGDLAGFARSLAPEFPSLPRLIHHVEEHLVEEVSLWDVLGLPARGETGGPADFESPLPGESEASDVTTEIEGRGQMDVAVVADPEEAGDGAAMPVHTFEKAETLEETSGLSRKKDDEDELEDHEEALREVDMKEVMRSPERPRSIYRSDLILDGLALEIDDAAPAAGIPYPEWDYRKRRYKEGWCHLQVHRHDDADPEWVARVAAKHAALVRRLKRQFASLTTEYLKLRRQPFGNDFDLDAVVDSRVRLRAGGTPDERLYTDRKKDLHDVAAIVLLDLSFSTDAWVRDMRVLDAIMETVYCVGEVIDGAIEGFAVAAFSSNTRRSCRFELLKDFGDTWVRAKQRFGTLRPQGYTRIGPALRHAQELLVGRPASRKIVILVTDGRPCDYDRYEGTYGIRDVRKAIETGRGHGLRSHAFAIEKQACETFPQMFGRDHFDVVSSPDELTRHMSRLFARLVAT
jgi:nitric oxide reductase NorD protein